ncbi:MAG: ornithine cyclodeaminase family protein [Bacteroidetes bacterium]|nr:MAG: ornithine cyclodeaminase family protein [Bacteroidota bacterium]
MTTIINLQDILSAVKDVDVVAVMEEAFVEYSNGNSVVPPVGELLFDKPKGDTHIKYGYIKGQQLYCIKIASGFYDNPKLGLSSSQGMMLLFSQKTGEPVAILLDEGKLTDLRTAAAGALAAKYFAPQKIKAIGIIGTGIQARLQLQYLQKQTNCKEVWIWGRNTQNVKKFKDEIDSSYAVHIASSAAELAKTCNLIVSTTSSNKPLLFADDIMPGTHITAMGSDTSGKQELESKLLERADILIADSISQSKSRGEVFRAIEDRAIKPEKVQELGNVIQKKSLQRTSEEQISIVDLTGVAVQDIMIATAVYKNHFRP